LLEMVAAEVEKVPVKLLNVRFELPVATPD
jgi:hypothetical protein